MPKKTPPPSTPNPSQTISEAMASSEAKHPSDHIPHLIPGEILLGEHDIVAFANRLTLELTVTNHGDRPIQVGSHCHFFEVNRALRFNRKQAFGFRLKVPSGTAVRFEPGEEKRVSLVAFGGNRIAYGINGLTNGSLDNDHIKAQALSRAAGFLLEGGDS